MRTESLFRVIFLGLMGSVLAARCAVAAEDRPAAEKSVAPVPYRIQLDTLRSGFDKKTCWVHARAGAIPGDPPRVVLTMQKLLLSGSDIYSDLSEMRTDDMGKTWTGPLLQSKTLDRRNEAGGVIWTICDLSPKWHAQTGKLLAIGHTVRYANGKVMPNRKRETGYTIYDDRTRTWAPWTTLAMPDVEKFFNSGAGSVQRLDLPNGDILLPISFKGRDDKFSKVTVLRCRFDGKMLAMLEQGNELRVDTVRGIGEPSLTCFRGKYYMTIRHDGAGYVSASSDGLNYDPPRKWKWDDGSALGNYNTQQHWVRHDEGLFLVYTRRGADNDYVFRHRAPLFIGQIDPQKLCVVRATEKILVPNRGARLGNFGVTEINERETWVTVTEWMQTNPPKPSDYTIPMKYGSNNAVFAARILWEKPNRTWDNPCEAVK